MKFLPPKTVELTYQRYLQKYANAYARLLKQNLAELVPALKDEAQNEIPAGITKPRMDANIEDLIKKALEATRAAIEKLFPNSILRKWALAMIGGVNRWNKRNINRALQKGVRSKKGEVPDFEPLMRDGELTPYFQNLVDENVGLIRSIPDEKIASFKNDLVRLITQDANKNTIEEAITKYVDFTKGKPATIARDQVGKLNGQLNEYRQKQLGGKRYTWRTAKDQRVAGNPQGLYPKAKPDHWHREGKVFYWSKPPKGGHPGQRVRCRCYAEMVLDDILEA